MIGRLSKEKNKAYKINNTGTSPATKKYPIMVAHTVSTNISVIFIYTIATEKRNISRQVPHTRI